MALPLAAISPIASARAMLESSRPMLGRQVAAREPTRQKEGNGGQNPGGEQNQQVFGGVSQQRGPQEKEDSADRSRSCSRGVGSTSVAPSVRHENSTINACVQRLAGRRGPQQQRACHHRYQRRQEADDARLPADTPPPGLQRARERRSRQPLRISACGSASIAPLTGGTLHGNRRPPRGAGPVRCNPRLSSLAKKFESCISG